MRVPSKVRSVSWFAAGAAIAAFVQIGAGHLGAATPTIYACVTNGGQMQEVSTAPLTCTGNKTLLTWNVQGQPGPAGAPGPAGPPGPGGGGFNIVDSRGAVLGPQFTGGVGVRAGNQWLLLQMNGTGVYEIGISLAYETTDCSGAAYVLAYNLPPVVQVSHGQFFYPAAPIRSLHMRSYRDGANPCQSFWTTELVPVGVATPLALDLSSFVPPFSVQ